MAQVVPINECEGAALGFAYSRAQCMERKTIPFRKALVFDEAQILFQKIGPHVRAIVTSPEYYGPGYRGAAPASSFDPSVDAVRFKYAVPTGSADNSIESSSLYSKAYITSTDDGAKLVVKYFANGALISQDSFTPYELYTDLVALDDNPDGTKPADARSEILKKYVVSPIDSFSPYPAALITATLSNAAIVELPPAARSMNGDIVLTTTSMDGSAVKTISGYAEERFESTYYDPTGRAQGWIGSIIPWKPVEHGEDGSVSVILAHVEGTLSEEFGQTLSGSTTAGVVMTASYIRYVVSTGRGDTQAYSVLSHALKVGKAFSYAEDGVAKYRWKNAPTGTPPAAVTCPNGDVLVAYACLTGEASTALPTGLTTVVRLAGATAKGAFDVETAITGKTKTSDIVRLRLAPAVGNVDASAFLFYALKEGSNETDYIATIKFTGAVPSVTTNRLLGAKPLNGVGFATKEKLFTVADTQIELLNLATLVVSKAVLPTGALTFKCTQNTAHIACSAGVYSVNFVNPVPVLAGAGPANTDHYVTGKNMGRSLYKSPVAGTAPDEKSYEFLLKPLQYTKKDDPFTAYGFTTYQWEYETYTTYFIPDHENVCGAGFYDRVSDYPVAIDMSHAYQFGVVNMPNYNVSQVPFTGGFFETVSAEPPVPASSPNPAVVGAALPNNFVLANYIPPNGIIDSPAGRMVTNTVNQFTTVYPGLISHYWMPEIVADELIAWMQV